MAVAHEAPLTLGDTVLKEFEGLCVLSLSEGNRVDFSVSGLCVLVESFSGIGTLTKNDDDWSFWIGIFIYFLDCSGARDEEVLRF